MCRFARSTSGLFIARGIITVTVLAGHNVVHAQIQSGLIGYWKLDGNYTDLSPGHRHLTPAGGIAFGPGVLGQGAQFPADANHYLSRSVDDAAYNFGSGDFTVSVWVNWNSTFGEQEIVEKFTGGAGPGWSFYKGNGNGFAFFCTDFGTIGTPAQSITLNTWHHLVVVRSGPSLNIWFNNVMIGGGGVSGAITPSPKPLLIGRRDGAQLFPINGRIDEVAIWSRALSGSEITDLYTAHQMICGCATQPSGFAGGDGTPENPYQVCSPFHLDNVRNHLSAHFVQTADINMSGISFLPIATNSARFEGIYDGNHNRISNFLFNDPTRNAGAGLFTVIGSNGVVEDLRIVGAAITSRQAAGILGGVSYGVVSSVSVQGQVTTSVRGGGLLGEARNTSVVEDCAADCVVDGTRFCLKRAV